MKIFQTLGSLRGHLTVFIITMSLNFGSLANAQIAVDADDIGGVVSGSKGPEAGVWVIAETDELDTLYRKIVVTDDEGRFLLPDLPKANYGVWVRGYGLADSEPVNASPGSRLDLRAVQAANAQEAAQVYPASYWNSLMEVPPASEFPGTGENGITPLMQTQADWIDGLKQGCQLCHQLGNKATREVPNIEQYETTEAAWDRRTKAGQRGGRMSAYLGRFGKDHVIEHFADWTNRIMQGEVPPMPPRPQGEERNVVLTQWEWSNEVGYIHDEIATDKRDPQINANGLIYGVDLANDQLVWMDPETNEVGEKDLPVRDVPGEGDFGSYVPTQVFESSSYWGDEVIWNNPANPHNPMMDAKGRIWMTQQIRGPRNPDWCKKGSDNPFSQHYPIDRAKRHASYYDPATDEFELIDTCFNTHHLQFDFEDDERLYFSSVDSMIGWLDVKEYERTGDAQAAQGWCPMIVDTNGDGRITSDWVPGNGEFDPTKDKEMASRWYGIIPDPTEPNVVWAAGAGGPAPGHIARLDLGDNPPSTCITEFYEPPFENPEAEIEGFGPRGIDITTDGIVWTALSGSGHIASFDRSKCDVFNGPTATGQQCPQGWKLHATPGPQMKGVETGGSADFHYYNWVDQFNTLGLGDNVPIATGSSSDSLLAFLPEKEEFVIMRVPYPLGFYSRGLDGRIDDPDAGWKGRGVWANYGTNTVWHLEGGKGTKGSLVKFQIRPDPLAH